MSLLQHANRASIILLKTRYSSFWQKALYPSVFSIFAISYGLSSHCWFTDVSFQMIDAKDPEKGYDWASRKTFPLFRNNNVMILVVTIVALGSIICNAYVIYYITHKAKSQQLSTINQKKQDTEKRLFVFTLVSFVIHMILAVFKVSLMLHFYLATKFHIKICTLSVSVYYSNRLPNNLPFDSNRSLC